MSTPRGPFEPHFVELPVKLPLFPLSGALLLPGGRLPLNIFEPRYLAMVRDVIASPQRLLGMIQPKDDNADDTHSTPLYEIGCAGRISSYNEAEDGRIMITLSGVARFSCDTVSELEEGYILGQVNWDRYAADLTPDQANIDRSYLMEVLRHYFDIKGFKVDWEHIDECENERLISTLSMICPFSVAEKQALLEADNLENRTQLLIAIMEMSSHREEEIASPRH
jgi:Lon protease-like protein